MSWTEKRRLVVFCVSALTFIISCGMLGGIFGFSASTALVAMAGVILEVAGDKDEP